MLRLAFVAAVLPAAAVQAAPVQVFHISGETGDGGSFAGWLVNDEAARDTCPSSGIGCFGFSRGEINGVNPFGSYGMPYAPFGNRLWYQIRGDEGARTIYFGLYGASGPNASGGHNEVDISLTYEYLSPRASDRTWDGDLSALGALLESSFYGDYLREGYWADVTEIEIRPAPVPLPATLPLLAAGLSGLVALGRRKRRAT